MAVLSDYIKWRGDLEFWQDGFNEFDNLVFSAISYVMMDEIFNTSDCKVLSLRLISDSYFSREYDPKKYGINSVLNNTPEILRQAAACKRYDNVLIRNYVSTVDTSRTLQFAAMEFLIPDGTSFIAFRGTDDTIVGWKEDFMMSVSETEAERDSVAYLNLVASCSSRNLRIGGHSKGGHLAVYAAAFCDEKIKDRILRVYSNDGPGFTSDFIKDKRTKSIQNKVLRILPVESIVGMLMEPVGKSIIVKSTAKGFAQHDLLSWCIDGMQFEKVSKISKGSAIFDKAITDWLGSFDDSERSTFVEELFSVLEASGMNTLTEIQDNRARTIPAMSRQFKTLSPQTKDKVNEVIKNLFSELLLGE